MSPNAAASWGHGKYGESGGYHIGARFDEITAAGLFASSPDSERGFQARLRYLLAHDGGGEAIYDVGLRPDRQTVIDWLTGDREPRARTRSEINRAYVQLRRQNQTRSLKGRLANGGRGTRITVEPLAPSEVPADRRTRQGQFDERELNVRPSTWNRFVDKWADGDDIGMDDVWMDDVCPDLGSPPEAWFEVAHVGFSA